MLTWGVVGASVGLAVAVAPFWVHAGTDLPPKGPSCAFEDDPGSGTSRVGVERVEWSLTPTVRCVPRGAAPSAFARARNVDLARYRDLWPVAAVALVPVAWAVIFLVGLVLRGDRAQPEVRAGRDAAAARHELESSG